MTVPGKLSASVGGAVIGETSRSTSVNEGKGRKG